MKGSSIKQNSFRFNRTIMILNVSYNLTEKFEIYLFIEMYYYLCTIQDV